MTQAISRTPQICERDLVTTDKQHRMADGLEERLRAIQLVAADVLRSLPQYGTSYSAARIKEVAVEVAPAAVRGDLGTFSMRGLAAHLGVPEALLAVTLQQPDTLHRLNFIAESVVRTQAHELFSEAYASGGPGVGVLARAQPTCPLKSIKVTYGSRSAFGLAEGRRSGTMDTIFAHWRRGGREESLNLGGLVKGLAKDAARGDARILSELHRMTLTDSTAATFCHLGASMHAIRLELPAWAIAPPLVLLNARFEGPSSTSWLASPTQTVPLISSAGYLTAGRKSLGDREDILVDAEESNSLPVAERGLERRHRLRRADGTEFGGDQVRELIDDRDFGRLGEHELALIPGHSVYLFDADLIADGPAGHPEGGQAVLMVPQGAQPPRWFLLLHRADGSRRSCDLVRIATALALLESPDSTAGAGRRSSFESLAVFDVPMSSPDGRENVWRIANAARQAAEGRPAQLVRVEPSPT